MKKQMKSKIDKKLESFRKKIDVLDKTIMSSIENRMKLSKEIGKYKKRSGISITDSRREKEILIKAKSSDVKNIYKLIFKLSKHKQK